MTVYYLVDENGGFYVGDTENNIASYAYPFSPIAECARRNPRKTALQVAGIDRRLKLRHERTDEWLAMLRERGTVAENAP